MTIIQSVEQKASSVIGPWLLGLMQDAVSALQAAKPAIMAKVQGALALGEGKVESLLFVTILSQLEAKNPILAFLLPVIEPVIQAELDSLVGQGDTEASSLFDKLVAFLVKEENYL